MPVRDPTPNGTPWAAWSRRCRPPLPISMPPALTMDQWLQTGPTEAVRSANPQRTRYSAQAGQPTMTAMKRVLFHQFDRSNARNGTLGYLDQGWRLRHKEEVILFGRIARSEGLAEEATTTGSSPSRLWLGSLPAPGQTRPPLSGSLAQETYVRMIVPVRNAE